MDRIFLHDPGANDHFYAEDIRIDFVANSRLFHFGYPPLMRSMFENEGEELAEIFERAKETGVTTSLDLSLPDVSAASGQAPWSTILYKTLPNVDVFLPSIEEILFMLRRETYDQLRAEAGSVDILPLITPAILQDISAELHDSVSPSLVSNSAIGDCICIRRMPIPLPAWAGPLLPILLAGPTWSIGARPSRWMWSGLPARGMPPSPDSWQHCCAT